MAWQRADVSNDVARTHIPISRCSSVVSLSLEGKPMGQVKNKQRRAAAKRIGNVYDPFAPWRVLCIQAHPDTRSSLDVHDATKHFVNGPEAFLVTLCGEYRDAAKRLTAVYKAITDIVEPPPDFIFNLATRDKLLFEDDSFTYSRRYFWAYNTLGIMNEDLEEMILAYEETFKDSVWDGTDKIIWPGTSEEMASSKHINWRRKMKKIREDLEKQVDHMREIQQLNLSRMKTVKGLHNNLFNGTSVLESRRSVENAMITVQQGRNIKLLTLVTIFFLPLTFVTSVFGMTNMPQTGPMYHFAWATLAICIPTYVLIGSLNTDSGMQWWTRQVQRTLGALSGLGHALARCLAIFGYHPRWSEQTLHHKAEVQAPTWTRPKAGKRARLRDHEGIIPRTTFNGMPISSPIMEKHGEEEQDQDQYQIDTPTGSGEKESTPTVTDFGKPWVPKLSHLSNTGSPPPHRASIGVVTGSGPPLARAFSDEPPQRRKHRSMTLATLASQSTSKEDDAVSESSDNSHRRRSGSDILRRMWTGRKKHRDGDDVA